MFHSDIVKNPGRDSNISVWKGVHVSGKGFMSV